MTSIPRYIKHPLKVVEEPTELRTVQCKILPIDTPTRNGYVFTRDFVESMIRHSDYEIFGELSPDTTTPEVFLPYVSHKVTNIRIEGDNLVGDITILNTPHGKILNEIIDQVEFLPRGKYTEKVPEVPKFGTVNYRLISAVTVTSFDAIPKKD